MEQQLFWPLEALLCDVVREEVICSLHSSHFDVVVMGNAMGWQNQLKFSGKTNGLKISLIFDYFG